MERTFYNLTHRQNEIWYMDKMHPNTSVGVIAGVFRMRGIEKFDVLNKAINYFVKNNDAMRIMITEENGMPKQYISDFSDFNVEFLDFSEKSNDCFYRWEQEQTQVAMNTIEKPLFKFVMIKFPNNEGGFYIKVHHTIADAWGMTLLVNGIAKNYFEIENGTYADKKAPSYVSYIEKEREYENSERYKKDYEYWMKKYEEEPEVSILKERSTNNISARAKRKTFVLPDKLCEKISEYSKENKISVFAMYMTALSIYINRIKGKNKINVGTIILNRADVKEKNTMGMFVTTAPVSMEIDSNDNFLNFSKNVTKEMMALMRHQSYPFDVLQEEVRKKFGIEDVLYDIVLSYQNAKFLDKNGNNEYRTRWCFAGYQTNSLTIHINDRDNDGKFIVDYDYLSDLFYDKEIEFLHNHIVSLLWHGIDNNTREIKELEMVSENEKEKILYKFNDTATEYPSCKMVYELIEETTKRLPDKTAIICKDKKISYRELDEKANIVANKLRDYGVKPNDVVGIMANRSIEMFIGLYGIVKSGAAYLPIDPEYPKERIEYMLKDSHANILLTEEKFNDLLLNNEIKKFFIDTDFCDGKKTLDKIHFNPDDLMYLIYTSGSTGLPKGVMLTHKNVNNFIKGTTDIIDFNENKVIVSVTTVCFDIFVLESWLPLQRGLTIVLADEQEQNNQEKFNQLCQKFGVNMLQTTPSRISILTRNDKYLDYVKNITDFMVGGETFPKKLLSRLKSISNARIYNMYGPTETTVWSSIKDLTNETNINIGRPIANTKMYILDSNLKLCPIGTMGDLYIAGDGVCRGYFERDELNRERFIKNPYKIDEVIYKTGDLAKWMANGEIIHLGRNDTQVKIRGYRIELEDIEKNIMKIEGVKDNVISTVNGDYLIAYLVCNEDITVQRIRQELSKDLPRYMIPSYFVRISELPYTPNGKIDKKRLPSLDDADIMREEFVEVETEQELKLLNIWKSVLDVEKISAIDDFFSIGGDSLGAINLANLISEEFNITFSVKEIYDNPDIRRMAQYINKCIGDGEQKYDGVVLLKKSESKDNLFLVHAGNGSAAPYARLCSKISKDINCFAIPYPDDEIKEYPRVITMDYLAEKYVKIIRNIQPHGPYKLFGWCIGANIITEVIHKLEERGENVEEVYLVAALSPHLDNDKKYFNSETEKIILSSLISDDNIKTIIFNETTVEGIWEKFIQNCEALESDSKNIRHKLEQMMLPLDITRAIPNYHTIDLKGVFKVLNIIRTVTAMDSFYEPNFTINAQCYYFNPTEDVMLGEQQINKYSWKNIFNKISFIDMPGDHFSFFEKGTDTNFIKEFNERINLN